MLVSGFFIKSYLTIDLLQTVACREECRGCNGPGHPAGGIQWGSFQKKV